MAEGQSSMSTRWNPTREQIALLEALYSQGIRTPKADQIEQIASRLRMYGNIEGKNVFYWFQNHKARERQRQKQKEERVASINQFLQPPSFVGTPHTNGYFPIQPQSAVVESSLPENFPIQQQSAMVMRPKKQVTADDNEPPTLELFPLHPTGIVIYKSGRSVCNPEYRSEPVNLSLCSPDENGDEQNDASLKVRRGAFS